jgi:hypothetical protein
LSILNWPHVSGAFCAILHEYRNFGVDELQADEMAKTFRQRVAQAEAAARAEELRLQQEVFEVSTILITFATMMLFNNNTLYRLGSL